MKEELLRPRRRDRQSVRHALWTAPPQVVRFDATPLWHFDAAEWARRPQHQTRSFGDVGSMSGLPPKADLSTSSRHVAQVPKPDVSTCSKRRARMRSYSITSSARARTGGGMSRPSVLAVFRLMTSLYLVGACTGRPPGFSPLRMRST